MTTLHIFRANAVPLTKSYRDPVLGVRIKGAKPRSLAYARCCKRRRQARNCVVQYYYDGVYVWCAPGKGCKA